jgi:RNA polymerase sigma factor (sigma-70 family)
MTQEEEAQLVKKILEHNDQRASGKLYNWYYGEVKTYLKKKFKIDGMDLEDLASDAISKSFMNLSTYDESKSSFKTWLYTIAENVVINHKKKLENRVEKLNYHYLEDAEEKNFDIVSNEDHEELFSTQQALNFAVSDLDDEQHDMLKKKYVEGYSHSEIGEIYSLTSSTVSNKINYVKSKLTKKLKKNI